MIIVVCTVAFLASILTFYSGFGLGTLLSGVLFLFFDVPVALAMTAMVHLLNNIFKFYLMGKYLNKEVLLQFGIPSIIGAALGAILLTILNTDKPMYSYVIGDNQFNITILKTIVGLLMIAFTLIELFDISKKFEWDKVNLKLGGIVSGFFGGLSGHQGALRTLFLAKLKLSKETFIATGIGIACLVDITRLPLYYKNIQDNLDSSDYKLIALATLSAFAGAYLGSRLIKKVTIDYLQKIVSAMLILFGILMIVGLV